MENNNLSLINKFIENCDYTSAVILLEKKFKENPNDIKIIDLLSEVYFNLNNYEGCGKLINKSIRLNPNCNGEKYMTLAQIKNNPKESLILYKKGIEIFYKDFEKNKENIVNGYANIASLFMTTNLCEEKNAENLCEEFIKKGLEILPENIDILMQLSNLRILRKKDEEALKILNVIYNKIFENFNENLPEREILVNLSKNYAEIEKFDVAIEILNLILKIDDLDIESFYYKAFYNYKIKNFKESKKILNEIFDLYEKNKNKDFWDENVVFDIIDASKELFNVLEKMEKNNELINNNLDILSEEEQSSNNNNNIKNEDLMDEEKE